MRSTIVPPAFPTMHPSHMCPPDLFFTCSLLPVCVHKCDAGLAWSVNTTVLSPFGEKPISYLANSVVKFPRGKLFRAQCVQKAVPHLPTLRPFFISFQSLASVTHGHGTQALYWRCAKQKDRAKIFHCIKLENKAS